MFTVDISIYSVIDQCWRTK